MSEQNTEKDNLLTRFTNALDCCGTCAGGVLNRYRAEAWERCAKESHDLGWLHDWALSDLLERNPYRQSIPPARGGHRD